MNERFEFLKNKWVKWLALGLGVLVVLGFVLSTLLFQPWLRNKLETEVKEKTDGLYALNMDDLSASLVAGTLTIHNFRLTPDSAAWQKQHIAGKPELTSRLTSLQAKRLKLTGVNYLGLALKKPLDLGGIEFLDPVLHIDQMREDTTASEPLHKGLSGPVENLKVKRIRVKNGAFSYKKDFRHQYNTAEASGLNMNMEKLALDSASFKAEDRIFYARHLEVSAEKTNTLMPDGLTRLRSGLLSLNSETGQIKLKNVNLNQVYKPAELARRKGEATTWVELKIPEIVAEKVDLGLLAREGSIAIEEIALEQPQLKAFKDKKNFTDVTFNPLPHIMVQEFKGGLQINKITVSNMRVRYDELASDAKAPGHISLRNFYASIYNISNHKNQMTAQNPAVADVKFNLAGSGSMSLNIKMPLLDPNCAHTLTGEINDLDLTVFNTILEPAFFVGLKSGHVQKGNFNLNLNCKTATGKMDVKYTNLEIELLSKDEEKKQSLPKKVLSKIANKAVVKEENQPEDDGLRTAQIQITRQPKRSIFTYWKDGMEQGMLKSAGLEKFSPTN